jgi:hypothetical protein
MITADKLSIAELHTATLAIVQNLPMEDIQTAWVSGSLIEGLGNPSSDVDIFVALSGPIPEETSLTRKGEDHGVLALIDGNVRYDIEFWPQTDIFNLKRKLDCLPVNDPNRNNLHYLTYWETEFIHRLLIGLPICNEQQFINLKKTFDADRFSRFLMDTAIRRTDDAFDDAVGMMRAGQLRMAALRARDALHFSVDAKLYAHGVTNDKEKFRLRKLELLEGCGDNANSLFQQLWLAESHIPDDDEGLKGYVEDLLRLSSTLIGDAQDRVRNNL